MYVKLTDCKGHSHLVECGEFRVELVNGDEFMLVEGNGSIGIVPIDTTWTMAASPGIAKSSMILRAVMY